MANDGQETKADTKAAPRRGAARGATATEKGLGCVVLAAGQGTRMRSARAKVLHELLGRPMLAYPIELARALGADPVVAVLGHQRALVEAALVSRFGPEGRGQGQGQGQGQRQGQGMGIRVVEQTERLGTGHAVRVALPALRRARGILLVLYGDVPLLRRTTIGALVAAARRTGSLALITTTAPDPTGYGRIVRDPRGRVLRVVEQKDATDDQRGITEINAGIYAAPIDFFRREIPRLGAHNAAGEYYLTDIVARAAARIGVRAVAADFREVSGINDRGQLVEVESLLRARILARWSEHATLRDPASTVIEPDVVVGADAEIGRGVALRGRTRVGRGARIGDGVLLTDTDVGADAEIRPYTVATDAVIGRGAVVGPFAHLRAGTVLGSRAHVGNFVELKKTSLGEGSKANHLSYLGDAIIGRKVNVGAGTITCNYNGYEKRQTVIEDGASIGSDTQLVAPVKVGRDAVVAAGTTVTTDVPPGALAITRTPQVAVPGYAERLAKRYARRGRARPPAGPPRS